MKAIGPTLSALALAAGLGAPGKANAHEIDQRFFADYGPYAITQAWNRSGPPPWARPHRQPWLDPRHGLWEPEPVPAETALFENFAECSDGDDVGGLVNLMLNGAFAALSEGTFTSATAQAAAAAMSAALAAQAPDYADGCTE